MVKNNSVLPGVVLVAAMAVMAWGMVQWDVVRQYGVSSLTLAILIGVLLGNALPGLGKGRFRPGLAFAQRRFLRVGVALYGFNLSVQQIIQVGSTGILVDLVMVTSTLLVGGFLGRRLLGMDRETVLLASAGSADRIAVSLSCLAPPNPI